MYTLFHKNLPNNRKEYSDNVPVGSQISFIVINGRSKKNMHKTRVLGFCHKKTCVVLCCRNNPCLFLAVDTGMMLLYYTSQSSIWDTFYLIKNVQLRKGKGWGGQ